MTDPILRVIAATTHGRALVQPCAGVPAGVLVGFHGYYENAEVQLERLLEIPGASAWTCVSVQGLHRFYRGRTDEVVASWMTRQDRELAIADNLRYVDAAIEPVIGDDRATPVVFAGFSQGAAMAFRAGVLGRIRSVGVIAVGGEVPPELLTDLSGAFPEILLVRGARDQYYTQEKIDRDAAALRERRAGVQTVVVEAAHDWTPDVSREAGHFLRRFLR